MSKQAAFRQGINVALVLGVLTVLEAALTFAGISSATWFLIISLFKSALVVQYFMHVYRLWRSEESH